MKESNIILYETDDGKIQVDVILGDETIWLTQKSMAELFEVDRTVITKHLKNIFDDKELDKNSVCAKIAHTANDEKKYLTDFYNLDAIIAVGYRVNSKKATKFRIWATNVLKEYIIKGFKIVQNKFHFAITGYTAAELIYQREDSEKNTPWFNKLETFFKW